MTPSDDTPKRRGLGRGLNALFGDDENFEGTDENHEGSAAPAEGNSAVLPAGRKMIAISQLKAGVFQPRHQFNPKSLEELASSIRQHGLLQPILVRPLADGYEIVAGERRWRAAQIAQIHEVPVIIRELDDDATLEIALIENLQREDLNPIDEGRALQQLAEEFGYTHEQVADKVGKSRSYVANMCRLMELNPSVIAMVTDARLSAGHARSLLSLSHDQQEEQAKKVIALGLNVRQTEQLVGELQGRPVKRRGKESTSGSAKDVNTLALEREVSNVLGMKVLIDMKDKQQGQMVISFRTLDQLDEVLHRLSHNPGRLAIKG